MQGSAHNRTATVGAVRHVAHDPLPPHDPRAPRRAPIVVRGRHTVCRVQQWSFRPDVAQIVLYHQRPLPTAADFHDWSGELQAAGYTRLRTSAVATDVWRELDAIGMQPVQELALLEHDDPGSVAPRRTGRSALRNRPAKHRRTRTLRLAQRPDASRVDQLAFDDGWGLDDIAIHDVCRATPHHRARWLSTPDATRARCMAGYAITGRDGRQGFLQRLAVDPAQQRQGVGRLLVIDSLQWLARRQVHRVLVNTPTHNAPALALYDSLGFRLISERLRVYEQVLA